MQNIKIEYKCKVYLSAVETFSRNTLRGKYYIGLTGRLLLV